MQASCPVSGPIAIVCAHKQVKELWAKACEYDNIPVESTTARFSLENPFIDALELASGRLEDLMITEGGKER